jgi:glycosyltransferase involved in cell wall biosynthesis
MKTTVEKLSIVIPAYNEAGTIGQVLEKVIHAQLPDGVEREIIVVDDCSVDDTGARVDSAMKAHPGMPIKYIGLNRNRGKGYAVRTGVMHATGEVIVIQDADLEYDPDDYSALLQPILDGTHKVVYGSRLLNRANHYSYRSFYWGGRLISFVTSLLFGQKITDEPTCYKMFDAALLKSIPLTSNRFGFCPEVTAKVLNRGYRIKELPIHYYPRSKNEGKKIKWSDGIKAIYILIRYRLNKG